MFEEPIEIERTDKVVVVVVPYRGERLQCIGYSSCGGVEGVLLQDVEAHKTSWEHPGEELLFPQYIGYNIMSTNVNRAEIWVTLVNLGAVKL